MHKLSVSPIGPSDGERWEASSKPWEPQAAYVPSPEQQLTVVSQHDGQSISTTDLSSNHAGLSTPESQQTSNTSYHRDVENQAGSIKHEQQGDDSFYWHSGRSSSDPGEEDQSRSGSPTATPGDDRAGPRSSIIDSTDPQHEHQDAPIRAPSLSLTMSGAYGASALGFGGPSDWEYFGDYEAEEIDDEELYSKPRARLSETMVGGSAELLADFPLDARQERGGWELPGSEPDSRDLLLLPDKPPERSLVTGPSSAIVPQESPKSGESDYKVITGSPSAQALVTPRVTPSHEAALLDTSHDQQRPHMDDVIRAWSEAPHVGKVHDEALITQSSLDNDEEPAEVAEASLESTPRDRLLGVAVILRNVPSLPKLPKSIEEHGHDTSSASLNNMMITKDHDTYSVDAQISTIQTILHIDQANSGDMVQKGLSPSEISTESSLSSRRVLSEPSAGGTSLEGAPPVEESRNSVINEQPQSQREVIQTDPVGITQSSSQESVRDLRQPLAQDLQEKKPLAALRADQGDIEDGMANASLQSVGDPSAPTLHRATIQSSQQFSQEEPHPSESDIMEETLRPDSSQTEEGFPKNISLDDLHAQDDTAANQINLGEKTEISKIHAAVDELPSKDDIRSSPRQLDQPAPNDETPFSDDRPLPETHRLIDPYSDLDPWGKASLNRFAAMLREESRAENNKDKLNIFNVFTTRESRLRVILYGTEDELLITQGKAEKTPVVQHKPEKEKQAVQRANTMNVERSLKALPALPPDRESVLCSPRKALAPLLPQNEGRQSGARSMPSDINHKFKSEVEPIDQPSGDTHQTQLNFGGRPKVSPVPNSPQMIDAYSAKDASPSLVNDTSPSTKAVEVLEGSNTPISNARIAPRSEVERKAPVYVPLLFNEGPSEIKNYLANRKSVYRPYATLTQGSLDSGSNFGREPDVNIGGTASGLITAPTSLYNPNSQSKVVNLPDISTTKKQKVLEAGEARDLRRFVNADFHPLLLVLPQSNAVINDPSRLQDLKNVMEAVPDEFGFIHQSVVAWDAKAKKQREENDRQRHARQVESEQRIDSLFDDHEIGYGDISELESEFKRSEAARKADEDRSEYQTFVSEVFNIVWTRLHFELDQLIPHYEQYSTLMNNTLAGRDMFEDPEGLALAPTMSCFLALHQKVEIRHQKAFEAVLERDRRLKKTEISPWYTLSNISKVKQLEKQFEDAEKRAIIEYCQQRDARANRLMDVLDQNTLRGVGANQDYMEAIMKAVRRIASGRAFASVTDLSEPTAGLEEVEKAKATTALLTTSSEQIVQTFHVADMLLNSADYEVSVAKAKVAKADLATLAKLKEERAK